jgi:phosphoribosylformylglycinamidine synthase
MWPCRSQKGEDARLYKGVKALSDFCIALGVNVPTGKDSLSMTQKYPNGEKIISPGTVIVSSGGEVPDVKKVESPVLAEVKNSTLLHIDFSFDEQRLGGSAFAQSLGKIGSDVPTVKSAEYFADAFNAVQTLVEKELVLAGHDISAGGMIVTLLEMCFANVNGGLNIDLSQLVGDDIVKILFSENPGLILQIDNKNLDAVTTILEGEGVGYAVIGRPSEDRNITLKLADKKFNVDINKMRDLWFRTSYLLDRKQSMNGCADKRYENYSEQPLNLKFNYNFTGKLADYGLNPDRREATGIKAAIIREKGTNGEREMAYTLWLAGFDVKDVTMTDLVSGRETLEDINMIVFCGGFSNSDVLGSAKGWAGAFLFNPKAKAALDNFYARKDTLSLGICNGCQLMIELGLVNPEHEKKSRMLHNDSHKFESSFLGLTIPQNNSVMFSTLSGNRLGVWVAHGEGKFSLPYSEDQYNVIAHYTYPDYPANPNGSDYNVAGVASADGRHVAMMPHPERAIFPWQCGYYPADRKQDEITPWLEAFVNARKWVEAQK